MALGPAFVRVLTRADGSTKPPPSDVAWFRSVHGSDVLVADRPGLAGSADGLVTTSRGLPLLARAADCGMLAMASPEGVVGVAHAGWRGLVEGVIPALAGHMRRLGAASILGFSGPTIGPCCDEFGEDDLRRVCDAVGVDVSSTTTAGSLSLDPQAGIAAACAAAGVELVGVDHRCTACDGAGGTFYSHRARRDVGRHGVVAWLP